MDSESILGVTETSTRESGKRASGTAKEAISLPWEMLTLGNTSGVKLRGTVSMSGLMAIRTQESSTTE